MASPLLDENRWEIPLIQSLPIDVLAEIFWQYVHGGDASIPRQEFYEIPRGYTTAGDPIQLSHICTLWRAAILSLPTMWSTISVNVWEKHYAERLSLYLSRSGIAPLTLMLNVFGRDVSAFVKSPKDMEAVSSALSQLPRCRRFCMTSDWQRHEWVVEKLPVAPPLILEEFRVCLRSTPRLCNYLHSSPKLKSIKWSEVHYLRDNELINYFPPIDTLKRFKLGGCHNLEALAPCLRGFPSLEELSTSVWHKSSLQEIPIRLDHLRSLHLNTNGASDMKMAFASFELPSLIALAIVHCWREHDLTDTHADIGWDQLLAMLERSGSKLQTLDYQCHGYYDPYSLFINEEAVARVLTSKTLDSLTHLCFDAPIRDTIIIALTHNLSEGDVSVRPDALPKLKKLKLNESWSTDGLWSTMVRSRSGTELEDVDIVLRGPFESEQGLRQDMLLTVPGIDIVARWDPNPEIWDPKRWE